VKSTVSLARGWIATAALLALPLLTSLALAEPHEGEAEAAQLEHGDAHEAHGESAHGESAHGAAHGPGEINWFYGMIAESDDAEPSLLWRPKGMPAPLLASILNTAILFGALYVMMRDKVRQGLKDRKHGIIKGFEEAAEMRDGAATRLAEYEQKLAAIDQEIARVQQQMREAAELERQRVLQEAKERRERLEQDAQLLITQELKAARERLIVETTHGAMESAERLIQASLTSSDKERLLQEYLAAVAGSLGSTGAQRPRGSA
jgi:F-type H+-transporting ATPase subunit b